jgi:hypothetical protein
MNSGTAVIHNHIIYHFIVIMLMYYIVILLHSIHSSVKHKNIEEKSLYGTTA